MVGIRGFSTPSLEAVERRRSELWTVAFLVIVSLAVGLVLLSRQGADASASVLRHTGVRAGLVLLTVGLAAYVLEKERHLRRLTLLLFEERVLTAALSNRLKELATLLDVGKAMNSTLALEQVLGIILGSAQELLGAGSGSVMLLEPGPKLRVVCEQGNADAADAVVALGEGIAGQVAERREPLLISGVVEDGRARTRGLAVTSAMSVPLLHRGDLLGVLNLNGTAERSFSEYDLRALALFAEHAAISISNARLYEAEVDHVAELTALDRMKTEFVATVSHELRTPLTSILGCTRMMMRRPLPPETTTEFLGMIERQGMRLLGLLEDALDVDRATRAQGELEDVDLADALGDVVALQRASGRSVEARVPDELRVMAHLSSFERVFTNLLDNAATHGSSAAEIEAEDSVLDGRRAVLVSVLDRGPGVPPDQVERVFERFQRGPGASAPGMGLGLYLVRSLVERQGGRVWVEQRQGGGAAFRIVLQAPPT